MIPFSPLFGIGYGFYYCCNNNIVAKLDEVMTECLGEDSGENDCCSYVVCVCFWFVLLLLLLFSPLVFTVYVFYYCFCKS